VLLKPSPAPHWNVIGTNFRDLHLQLDEIVDIARESSDTIAERMRALNAVPDGRTDTVAASTTLPAFPPAEQNTTETVDLITNRIYAAVSTIRTVHDAVDALDPSTSDLLHEIIDSLEKQAWMLKLREPGFVLSHPPKPVPTPNLLKPTPAGSATSPRPLPLPLMQVGVRFTQRLCARTYSGWPGA